MMLVTQIAAGIVVGGFVLFLVVICLLCFEHRHVSKEREWYNEPDPYKRWARDPANPDRKRR